MRNYRILLISFLLLFFILGAVSASDASASDTPLEIGSNVDDVSINEESNSVGDSPSEGIKEIYVNDTGDDSNTGSINSPYSSIGKAVADVNSASNYTIYLSKGTFGKDNDTNFQFTNRVNTYFDNCNVTFIGAGSDKTFIDGQSAFKFMTVQRIAPNLVFKDITFVNFKGSGTSTLALSSSGSLTIENCIFKDCYSTSTGDTISASACSGDVKIINSQFINLNGGAINVQYGAASPHNLYLMNNTFINITNSKNEGAAVYTYNSKANVKNNRFINVTCINQNQGILSVYYGVDDDYSIIVEDNTFINCNSLSSYYATAILNSFQRNVTFENNTFINSTNAVGNNVWLYGRMYNLNFNLDVDEINVGDNEIRNGAENVPLDLTDDMGNRVYINQGITFNLIGENNNYTPSYGLQNKKISFYTVPDSGIYNVTVTYNDGLSTTDVLAIVKINASTDPFEIWVSPKGSDANNGSEDNPFKTIQHALDVGFEKSFNVVLHILKGTYQGDDNVNLTIANKGSLKIIGEEYNETIIDGEGSSWFMKVSTCNVNVEKLKFINGFGKNKHVISGSNILNLKDCIVDNNAVSSGNYFILDSVLFDNLVYTNNKGSIQYGAYRLDKNITDSYFANNSNIYNNYGVIYLTYPFSIINCRFINNTATKDTGVIYCSNGGFKSEHNYYYGNKAKNYGIFWVSSSYGIISINDTFENNHADESYGIGSLTGATVIGSKFINNSAAIGGVGIIDVKSSFKDCSFINNSATNGGVFVLNVVRYDLGTTYNETVKLEDVTFENNKADNGNDIYLTPSSSSSSYYSFSYPIELTINYNNVVVNSLIDNLTANVYGPNGMIVGGPELEFILNNVYIGSAPIVNGYATLEYAGFSNGKANVTGNIVCPSELNVVNGVVLDVNVPGALDHIDFWVSNSGSDENGNGSENNPFKTIQFAVNKAFENCRDTTIYLKEETYSGEGNTNLTLSCAGNLTIIGKGIGKTLISGDNANYFADVAIGVYKVIVSDLTIINMSEDNRFDLPIGSTSPSGIHSIIKAGSVSPITVDKGATLYLDNVNITGCHGGVAIIDGEGSVFINNSILYENGVATGIINCENLVIDNTVIDKHLVGGYPIRATNIVIKDSKIIDVFNIIRNGFYLISRATNTTIENTEILTNDWENPLNMLNITESYDTAICPAACIASTNTYVADSTFRNEFYLEFLWQSTTDYSYHNVFSGSVNAYNSSFEGYKFLIYSRSGNNKVFSFDGCVINNVTKFAIFLANRNCNISISNSVYLSPFDSQIQNTAALNNILVFENNYWGDNSQPELKNTVANSAIPAPGTWIILTSEGDEPVFKLTDGENITAYTGSLPAKISYVDDENGDVIPVLNIAGTGYKFSVDENASVVLNTTAEPMRNIVPKIPADETLIASDVTLIKGENAVFTATFTNKWGDPLKGVNVSFVLDEKTINRTTNENGTASFDIDFDLGQYTLTITNPVTDESVFKTVSVKTEETTFASDVKATFGDGSKFSAKFTDEFGVPLANANVTFSAGENTINAITDANGTASFVIDFNAGIYNVTATNPATGQSVTKAVVVTVAETIDAGDVKAVYGDGSEFSAKFTDEFGSPLANTNVTFKVGENTINATTDANGTASFVIDFNAGNYNVTAANPVTGDNVTKAIVVSKLATKLSASKVNMVYNTGKYLKATLKDANGKALAKQTVYIKINGKTYKRTTNAKGQVSLKITLPVKNAYAAAITYKGTANYVKSSASAKVVVKKAAPKMAAKKATFKVKKAKKYTVVLKNNKGKAMNKAKITLTTKVKGKTVKLTVKTKSNGKATFNLKKLAAVGKYTAKVKFAGNKNFKAVTKTVKITVTK